MLSSARRNRLRWRNPIASEPHARDRLKPTQVEHPVKSRRQRQPKTPPIGYQPKAEFLRRIQFEAIGTKIKARRLAESPLDENPYADWTCHLFTAGRTQSIIASNTTSLYSCVMYGRGITDDSRFVEHMLATIREFMEDDGQAFAYQRFIASASGSVTFAKSLNRSVTGSMNDLIKFAKHWLAEDDLSPHDVGFKLNDILLSALATTKARGYGKPNEVFKAMLGTHSAIDGDKQ